MFPMRVEIGVAGPCAVRDWMSEPMKISTSEGEVCGVRCEQANEELRRERARLVQENARLAVLSLQQENDQLNLDNARLKTMWGGAMESAWMSGYQPVHILQGSQQLRRVEACHVRKMSDAASDSVSTSGSAVWSASEFSDNESSDGSFAQQRVTNRQCCGTTVIMRNIPNRHSHKMLVALFDKMGFQQSYDLVYLPFDFATGVSLGYAFVNLQSVDEADRFLAFFNGFSAWGGNSKKVCTVIPCGDSHNLNDCIERYRNMSIMHSSVPDDYKPALYLNGKRVPFPAPTKRVRNPKHTKA